MPHGTHGSLGQFQQSEGLALPILRIDLLSGHLFQIVQRGGNPIGVVLLKGDLDGKNTHGGTEAIELNAEDLKGKLFRFALVNAALQGVPGALRNIAYVTPHVPIELVMKALTVLLVPAVDFIRHILEHIGDLIVHQSPPRISIQLIYHRPE